MRGRGTPRFSPALVLGAAALLVLCGASGPATAADRAVPPRWAVWPRAVFGGGGLGVSVTHRPSRIHFDLTADARAVTLGAPRAPLATPGLTMFPFARVRPRVAVGLPRGALEVAVDVSLLARSVPTQPIRLDPTSLAPHLRAHVGVEGTPERGLRLSTQLGLEALGAETGGAGLVTPYLLVGGRARVTFASWMGSGLPLPRNDDFAVADPEGPAPLNPQVGPLLLLFADVNPTGGVYLDAWVDTHGGSVQGTAFAGLGAWPVVPRLRAEFVASAPLPVPVPAPFPVLGALEIAGVVGLVPTDAPAALGLPYPGALTRDPRLTRGESLMKVRFALRLPIGPPPPPAPNLLVFGVPTVQLDLGLGDTWGYRGSGGTARRALPGVDDGDTAGRAGEVGLEFRLPMAWAGLGWTLWARGEVGLRSGAAGFVAAPGDPPWLGERGVRAPLGFALGLGVPAR